MYFEIREIGVVKKRFDKLLSEIEIDNEIMSIPTLQVTLPITLYEYLKGRREFNIVFDQEHSILFQIVNINPNFADGIVDLELQHIFTEWSYRQVPTNKAVKDTTIEKLYQSEDMCYSKDWEVECDSVAKDEIVDYVYSRQTMEEALTKTVEMTQTLWWRIPMMSGGRKVQIGEFGEKKQYTLSVNPQGHRNIQIIEEPQVEIDGSSVVNVATVYSEKSDTGASSMSLREVFNDESLQNDKFPIIIMRTGINNERFYDYSDIPKIAPNTDIEYSVVDTESVAMESGIFIEGTYAFNDLSPFSLEDQPQVVENEGVWNPTDFMQKYMGTVEDVDHTAGSQCVDLWKICNRDIGNPNYNRAIGGDGYAHYIWYNRVSLGYMNYFVEASTPQFGDWVIFGKGGSTPFSHVGMVVTDNGDTLTVFGMNQGQAQANTTNIEKTYVLGYLRVKSELWSGTTTVTTTNGASEISDEDRIKASKVAYDSAVKKLRNARRSLIVSVTCTKIPYDLEVGDRIRLVYPVERLRYSECSRYMKKMLKQDDWWYIKSMTRSIDIDGTETGELSLEKYLRLDREVKEA